MSVSGQDYVGTVVPREPRVHVPFDLNLSCGVIVTK